MVGWIPLDMSLRLQKAAGFIDRVKKSQAFGLADTPVLLQYDRRVGDMRPWIWWVPFCHTPHVTASC